MRCISCGIQLPSDKAVREYCTDCKNPKTGELTSKDAVWQHTTSQIAQTLSIDENDALFLTNSLLTKLPRWNQA